jgi:hypothetical protein
MNNWQAVGYIFLGFCLVFLAVGVVVGYLMDVSLSAFGALFASVRSTAVFVAGFPWFIIGALCLVVSVVGLVAGR